MCHFTLTCPFKDGAAGELRPAFCPEAIAALRAAFATASTAPITHPTLATPPEA